MKNVLCSGASVVFR